MLEQKIRESIIPPKGEHPIAVDIRVKEATIFVQNIARKADIKSQVLIALDYLSQYGYLSNYNQQRFDRR